MTLDQLNAAAQHLAAAALVRCCGSSAWVAGMLARRPFADARALARAADEVWQALPPDAWLEALAHHPRIGERAPVEARLAPTAAWAGEEQAGSQRATADVLDRLERGNREYEARFGYVFVVCATGRSASEMLALLEQRLANDPDREVEVAAEEQRRITQLRLTKLLAEPS